MADETGSFAEFQALVRSVAATPKHTEKTMVIKAFLATFKGDLYLLFKLFLTKEDKRVFNLKDKAIAKVFAGLLNYSTEVMKKDLSNGDVSETVRKYVLLSKQGQSESTLTLHQVDGFLEQFTKATREEEQRVLFRSLLKVATAEDMKFFILLMMHDLKMWCGAKYALAALHDNAYDAFRNTSDLKKIVDRVLGRSTSGVALEAALTPIAPGGIKTGISLNLPVKPMLAKACASIAEGIQKCPKGLFSEIKYDGERIQIHKDGTKFQFFSRNLKTILPWKVKPVEDYIPKATNAHSIILDGEILLIDNQTGVPLPFGSLNVHKKNNYDSANVCVFLFDVLFLNGNSLLNLPIIDRRKIMEENVNVIPNHVMLSEYNLVHEEEDLADMMNTVLRNGLEGLVLKSVDSVYEPAQRHWLKIKKDYLLGGAMADAADLVPLGGYYGKGQKGGMVTVFLMCCLDPSTQKWLTVCKCGSGFDDATLVQFQKGMLPLMRRIDRNYDSLPSWLVCSRMHCPDWIFLDPKRAPVWEIFGAEFCETTNHTSKGVGIRFPRCARIRDDKDWASATTLPELQDLAKASKQHNHTVSGSKKAKDGKSSVSSCPQPSSPMKSPPVLFGTNATLDSWVTVSPAKRKAEDCLGAPPVKRPRSAIETVVEKPCGMVHTVSGDVLTPVAHFRDACRVIFVAAPCGNVEWPRCGIFRLLDNVAENARRMHGEKGFPEPGDIHVSSIPCPGLGGAFVALAGCVMMSSHKTKPPEFSVECFKGSLGKALALAAEIGASLHIPEVKAGVLEGLDPALILTALEDSGSGITIYTYQDVIEELTSDDRMGGSGSRPNITSVTEVPTDGPLGSTCSVVDLQDIFTDCIIHLDNSIDDATAKKLKRYLVAYDGAVEDIFWSEGGITHVVSVKQRFDERLEGMLGTSRKAATSPLKVVTPEWVWQSVSEGKRLPERAFFLPRQ